MSSRAKGSKSMHHERNLWSRGKWWFIGSGIAGALALLILLPPALSGSEFTSGGGKPAPDILLTTASQDIHLTEMQGDILLLFFAFPGCPSCALEAPALAQIQSEYVDRGVTVVAVNIQPQFSLSEWTEFWKSTGAGDVLWAQDKNSTTLRDYQLVALGSEVLVDRQGRVAYRSDGPAGYKKLRARIEELL